MAHSTADLNQSEAVEISKDENGISRVLLRSPRGASAMVSLYGGQVRSWKTEWGEELLFTSRKAILKSPAAVRGGVSVCFPKFANIGEQHGFARKRMWVIEENPLPLPLTSSTNKAFIDLLLKPSDDDLKWWPHRFEFRLRVTLTVDGHLTLVSRIRNVQYSKPFSFSFAYHTYLSVSDISEVRVEGVETLDYYDNLVNRERFTQRDTLTFESEVDRAYLSSSEPIVVFDHEKRRTFVIKKDAGLPDIVVWNPWERKSKSIIDFGDEEYKHMVCVDAACIDKQITINPGEEWTGRVKLYTR